MFHPEVVAEKQHQLETRHADQIPGGVLVRHSHDECWAMRDQLNSALDAKGLLARELTPAELTFQIHERWLAAIDYRYWSERWAIVAKETQDAEPLVPRWASQDLFLDRISGLEYAHHRDGHPDGVLINVLKARQLGISTETEVIVAHRATTQTALRGLVAADVREQSQYMFGMAELVIESLPWWLCPPVKVHQRGDLWQANTGASIATGWGKSARGGMQEQAKVKGNIGRGKTYGILHLSELSTWEKPEQIDGALLPGVPRRPRTFAVFESTAKGRLDWWHRQWTKTERNLTRFTNVFIPWYIEPDKYWQPPPEGWVPDELTQSHAEAVERDSPKWCLGRTIRLSADQLYWYEQTRAGFEADGRLYEFYEEYPATPEESFQYSGRSIFSAAVLERIRAQERRPVILLRVEPAKDIAQLKAWEREEEAKAARAPIESPHD